MSNATLNSIDNICWKEFESKNGKKYQVGCLEKGNLKEQISVNELAKADFGIAVNWPITNGWMQATNNVANIASITRYNLSPNPNSYYAYILYFTNTQHYDYYFHDETGDSYEVNTYVNSDHYVRYNSDKPTISYISGS